MLENMKEMILNYKTKKTSREYELLRDSLLNDKTDSRF